jgi:hypothetical protein
MVTRLKYKTLSEWNPMRNFEFDKDKFPNSGFNYWLRLQLKEHDISKQELIDQGLKEGTILDWIFYRVKKPRVPQLYRLIEALVTLRGLDREALRSSCLEALEMNRDKRYKHL